MVPFSALCPTKTAPLKHDDNEYEGTQAPEAVPGGE